MINLGSTEKFHQFFNRKFIIFMRKIGRYEKLYERHFN